jgi:hypothetical protein
MNPEQLLQLDADCKQLKPLLNTLAEIYSRDVDIHSVTRQVGSLCKEFIRIEQKYQTQLNILYPAHYSFEDMSSKILAGCTAESRSPVTTVLNTIKTMPIAEVETGLNAQYLLQRSLALGDGITNALSILVDNLHHNIATNGGCHAGIAARLSQPYTAFLLEALKSVYDAYAHTVYMAMSEENVVVDFSDVTQEDILFCFSIQKTNAGNVADTAYAEDDEDLALAKALSLSLQL